MSCLIKIIITTIELKRQAKCRMTSASISPQAVKDLYFSLASNCHTFITRYTASQTSTQRTTLNGVQTRQAKFKLICLTRVKT